MSQLPTNAEVIGAGRLWRGVPDPDLDLQTPEPLRSGEAVGQHLIVLRMLRVAEKRHIYLVDTQGSKWAKRYCWSCGYKHSSAEARVCEYCQTSLRHLRFLMTARWTESTFQGTADWARLRKHRLGIVQPKAILMKGGQLLSLYQYNGERLLLDEPAPLEGDSLLRLGIQLVEHLVFLHHFGVVLAKFSAANVLLMPDGRARWYDLDIKDVLNFRNQFFKLEKDPVARDMRNMGALLQKLAAIDDEPLQTFINDVRLGGYPTPVSFLESANTLLQSWAPPKNPRLALGVSDVGLVRSQNEDSWGWRRIGTDDVLIVADGMGGHAAGDVASATAVRTVLRSLADDPLPAKAADKVVEKRIQDVMMAANLAVHAESKRRRANMGTTLQVLVIRSDGSTWLGHAGDCRAYRYRGGRLTQVSTDHTLVQDLLDAKRITPEQAKDHPHAHVVTVTVGADPDELDAEVSKLDVKPGDRVMMCSDGLHGAVPLLDMQGTIALNDSPRRAMRMLVRNALQTGGTDNITAVMVDI